MADHGQCLASYVSRFPSVRVLCLGDIMVDRYIYGTVTRISPEAPVPVIVHEHEEVVLGAVGNVARNITALGGHAIVVAIVGDDEVGHEVDRLIENDPNLEANLVMVPGRRTTLKTRYIAVRRGGQLLRADQEDTHALEENAEQNLIDAVEAAVASADVVLLSDYSKGVLCDAVLAATIRAARQHGKPVIVDPKSSDIARYGGVTLIKPNARELEAITGIACTDDHTTEASAGAVLDGTNIEALLVTRSKYGMTLLERDCEPRHFRERISEVFDVSGAGDTALATLGLAIGADAPLPEATELANKACNIVVSKVGTAVAHSSELVHAIRAAEFETTEAKIDPLPVILDKVARWRAQGAVIGFTNGCFDLIHAGHVSLLGQAKEACDRLVVGLNSDDSVRRLKGEGRPINNQTARAVVLASFGTVDGVVLFDEDTPIRLIETVRPDVLIKGADYGEYEVVGADFVKSHGGRVVLARLAPEHSTTDTINKIKG